MANAIKYEIWILDSTLTPITKLLTPFPLDKQGTVLQFSNELDDYGQCRFRVHAYDLILKTYGDILIPHHNWVQIKRNGTIVWQGAIIENTKRTKDYIECIAAEPLWYLDKVLLQRTSLDPSGAGVSATPSSISMSGTTATINFSSSISSLTGSPTPPSINDTISLTGFTPSGLNGVWQVSAVTSTSITVINVTGGPYTVSVMGTVTLSNGIYRQFGGNVGASGGTTTAISFGMDSAVTSIINQTIATFQANNAGHPLANMTLGTVTNPNYPPNMTNGANPAVALTGAWEFGNGITAPELAFDYQSVLYALKSMGAYTYADYYIDNSLVFHFVPFKGNNLVTQVNFTFGTNAGGTNTPSNIIDYNLPRFGQRMANHLYGIATDINGNILHYEQSDTASINTYGLIEGVAGFKDVKDQATLTARIQAELPLVSAPDNTAISVVLSEKGFPLGTYSVGDIVNISITNRGVSFSDNRRIVGITVKVNGTGREYITIQTNKVLQFQFALAGGQNITAQTT